MQICHRDALIEIQTPAKVNLFLEVLRRRADGFHEIETVITPIDLVDTLRCAIRSDERFQVVCRWTRGIQAASGSARTERSRVWEDLPTGDSNLVFRALQRLREASGTSLGLVVEIWKRIPSSAGLGGASSDAAAALVAANRLWQLDWPRERLLPIASSVGSDVPFFLHGSAALCRGRGEILEPVDGFHGCWLVVIRPPAGLSTADVYRQCRPADQEQLSTDLAEQRGPIEAGGGWSGNGARSAAGMCQAAANRDLAGVARRLFNRLQPAAEHLSPWIGRLRSAFERTDCLGHQMSGSGSSYFGICRHAGHARRLARRLRLAGLGAVFVTATGPIAACRRRTSHRGTGGTG